MSKDLTHVDQRLVAGFMQLSQVCNIKLESGYRDPEEQKGLYADRANNPYPVAVPGTSRHEKGLAIDISGDLACAHREGARFGVVFPFGDDPIHMQLAGAGSDIAKLGEQILHDKNDNVMPQKPADPIARVLAGATAALQYGPDEAPDTSVEGLAMATGKKPVAAPDPAAQAAAQVTGQPTEGGDIDAWIRQAMQITGKDESWFGPLKQKALQESGGRNIPQGITDINTAKGTPAFGPMQVIEPTFNAYKLPGYDNWKDPVHNIVAAIRYIDSRYGGDIAGVARRGGGY